MCSGREASMVWASCRAPWAGIGLIAARRPPRVAAIWMFIPSAVRSGACPGPVQCRDRAGAGVERPDRGGLRGQRLPEAATAGGRGRQPASSRRADLATRDRPEDLNPQLCLRLVPAFIGGNPRGSAGQHRFPRRPPGTNSTSPEPCIGLYRTMLWLNLDDRGGATWPRAHAQ